MAELRGTYAAQLAALGVDAAALPDPVDSDGDGELFGDEDEEEEDQEEEEEEEEDGYDAAHPRRGARRGQARARRVAAPRGSKPRALAAAAAPRA